MVNWSIRRDRGQVDVIIGHLSNPSCVLLRWPFSPVARGSELALLRAFSSWMKRTRDENSGSLAFWSLACLLDFIVEKRPLVCRVYCLSQGLKSRDQLQNCVTSHTCQHVGLALGLILHAFQLQSELIHVQIIKQYLEIKWGILSKWILIIIIIIHDK